MAFSRNFCPIKTTLSGNTVWPQASSFKTNVEWDFSRDFQTPRIKYYCCSSINRTSKFTKNELAKSIWIHAIFSDFFECFSNKYLKCTYQKIAAVSDSLNARRPTEKSLKTISHAAKFWATFGWKTKSVFVDWQKWTTRRRIENWNLRNPSSLQRLNSGGCEGYHWWLKLTTVKLFDVFQN